MGKNKKICNDNYGPKIKCGKLFICVQAAAAYSYIVSLSLPCQIVEGWGSERRGERKRYI
jgi:hypothetical protein